MLSVLMVGDSVDFLAYFLVVLIFQLAVVAPYIIMCTSLAAFYCSSKDLYKSMRNLKSICGDKEVGGNHVNKR